MRRKDREITDLAEMLKIVDGCDTCRLGLVDGQRAYIVPFSFGYTFKEGRLALYFHCAQEGRKIELLKKGGEIAFQMDQSAGMRPLPGGHYTMLYQSACGYGVPAFIEEKEEKIEALRHLVAHYSKEPMNDFPDEVYERTCVLRLDVTELTCKKNG